MDSVSRSGERPTSAPGASGSALGGSQGLLLPPHCYQTPVSPRPRLQVWFVRVCAGILVWTCLVQLLAVGHLWHRPHALFGEITRQFSIRNNSTPAPVALPLSRPSSTPFTPTVPARIYRSNGYLTVSCNGGLNQMRSAICDMVAVARLLNLTLVIPALDKKSFWADPSDFSDIFNVEHFINSLRDEVHVIKRLPKRLLRVPSNTTIVMPPVSWSNEAYYLQKILPLFRKYKVIHFTKTDARLANNGLSVELQKLRCRVNFHVLKFTEQIEVLGNKLVRILKERGQFVALHLRYEMDMLAFSGCTHGCSQEEAKELKTMRYTYPWWREKEIVSEQRRLQGMCPLTPEETALVLQALGFEKGIQIYIASGDIYGGQRRLMALQTAFPRLVKKEMLLDPDELWQFQNHSSQMAALDYMVSIASDVFVPTFDGNMAKVVEGHRRYLGFGKSIQLDRRKLVELLDLHANRTLSWDEFVSAVRLIHENRMGQPGPRKAIVDKPKEEDYFYANPLECLCNATVCRGSGDVQDGR